MTGIQLTCFISLTENISETGFKFNTSYFSRTGIISIT